MDSKRDVMTTLTFVPVGGLANRMRATCSAVALARACTEGHNPVDLKVVWFRDAALNCGFAHLFRPVGFVKEATFADRLLTDRPRPRNAFVPKLLQHLLFDGRLYEEATRHRDFDYVTWLCGHTHAYLASYTDFLPRAAGMSKIFQPIPVLQQLVDQTCAAFGPNTVGVHIRRGDHLAARAKSPLAAFEEAMEKEVELHRDVQFFVASDSPADKDRLMARFGSRIILNRHMEGRQSKEGMQGAVVDLFTLARTRKILGSYQSSFSEIASRLGNIPLTTILR